VKGIRRDVQLSQDHCIHIAGHITANFAFKYSKAASIPNLSTYSFSAGLTSYSPVQMSTRSLFLSHFEGDQWVQDERAGVDSFNGWSAIWNVRPKERTIDTDYLGTCLG